MLAEADMGLTQMALDVQNNRYVGDEHLYTRFFMHPRQDNVKSIEEGRPIFTDTEYVEIMQPGNKESIVIRPARETDKSRWPRQYQAFKNNEAEVLDGTPLEQWPGITRSQCEEMKHFHIRTVEQLVNMSDGNAKNFMGVAALKRRAEAYLAQAEDNKQAEALAAELEQRDNMILELQQTNEEFRERLAALEDPE